MTTPNALTNILSLSREAGDAVLIQGKHGIGKSKITQTFCTENDYHLETLFLSHQEVGDIIGIPNIVTEDGKNITKWSVPVWLQRMYTAAESGKHCVLFLDEFNRADLDVRQSAMELVLEGRIHEHILPVLNNIRTFIVSAINPSDDYQVQELDPALLDRFLLVNLEVSASDWLEYARNKNTNKIILDFIAEKPERLHYMPAEGMGTSPRSFDKLDKYMQASSFKHTDKSTVYDIFSGKLGSEIGSEFFIFWQNYEDILTLEDVKTFITDKSSEFTNIQDLGAELGEYISDVGASRKHDFLNTEQEKSSGKATLYNLLCILYAVEIEICTGFLKKLKADNIDKYLKLVELDADFTGKELFKKIVTLQ